MLFVHLDFGMVSRFLYIPNLIGYGRVILAFVAYTIYKTRPIVFVSAYALSQILDMFDGKAARAFNQATKFGAMLDMVTDRCSGIGLMLTLSQLYPEYTLVCHFFIWLDVFSHWCHMLAQLGSGRESHKLVSSGPWLLQYYYKTRWFMTLLIVGAEGWPLCLYLKGHPLYQEQWYSPAIDAIELACVPLFCVKHIINVIQFVHSAIMLDEPGNKSK